MLVVGIGVEENSKAGYDTGDDGNSWFMKWELVMFNETGGNGVEGEEE